MMEILQRQQDSHIPTTPNPVASQNQQIEEFSIRALEKWKSENRIPTFPPPRQPAAQGGSPPGDSGATAQGVNARWRGFALARLFAHGRPPWRQPHRILQRQCALINVLVPQPDMQFAVELMAQFHPFAGISLLLGRPRQLDLASSEANRMVLGHGSLVA